MQIQDNRVCFQENCCKAIQTSYKFDNGCKINEQQKRQDND